MCRNITELRGLQPPATPAEISAAWDRTADMFARQFPKVKELMDSHMKSIRNKYKSFTYSTKARGQPCKQGESAARSGCIPKTKKPAGQKKPAAAGGAATKPAAKKPAAPKKPAAKKPAAKKRTIARKKK
jgi:hypothetical protein